MDINDLYKILETIFVDYTTHNWKNGWEHEGDRQSKELTIQREVLWNNLFLLRKTEYNYYHRKSISVEGSDLAEECTGSMGFKIEVKKENDNLIRIDIESKQIKKIDIHYYVDNELDWLSNIDFISELCQNIYDSHVNIKKSILNIPDSIYGKKNPDFIKSYRRDRQLKDIGI